MRHLARGLHVVAIIVGGGMIIEILTLSYYYSLPNYLYFSMAPIQLRIGVAATGLYIGYAGIRGLLERLDSKLYYMAGLSAILSHVTIRQFILSGTYLTSKQASAALGLIVFLLLLNIFAPVKKKSLRPRYFMITGALGVAIGCIANL